VAELAAVQAIEAGWVLYLVPTNALAAQVRTDLQKSLESIADLEIRAFLGGEEYTSLPEEKVGELSNHTIAVMTPEKCALALRLAPNVFHNCRLCIFDECHLIGEEHRGALAELVLSHIIAASPTCRFLLMSAMLANPDDLASWLRSVTNAEVAVIDEDWRPTRAIRGVVGLDLELTRSNVQTALDRLKALPAHRKREKFAGVHCFVANLQGRWQSNETSNHAVFVLPTETILQVDRTPTIESGGWVNATATAITKHFADKNERVLTFLPASKHYPFSVGEKMDLVNHLDITADAEIAGLLDIAEDELGVESGVRILIDKGIAVHTAALLEAEKLASEIAFSRQFVPVMLATGTLAQGLNLPASVVIIGGTTIGDRREANSIEGQQRARAQLLNALGRAGRAGFGSHGLGLVVPNQPIYISTPVNPSSAREAAPVVAAEENSSVVHSRLERFLTLAVQGILNVRFATLDELTAMSYLSLGTDQAVDGVAILKNSYGMYRTFPAVKDQVSASANEYLTRLKNSFVSESHAPEWIPSVTYRTGLKGLDFLRSVSVRAFGLDPYCPPEERKPKMSSTPKSSNKGRSTMASVESFEPLRLYRYRSCKDQRLERELRAIKHGYLWCSLFTELNDPMEGMFRSLRSLRKHPEQDAVREEIISTKSQLGICSFSEVYDHQLMWAHYADEFRGICVGYSFSRLLSALPGHTSLVRMYYSEKEPTVRHSKKDPILMAKMVLSNKSYRWLHEREWRMFTRQGRGQIRYEDLSCVTHVYLGYRMEPERREQIRRDLEPMRIKISEMEIDKYVMSFKKGLHLFTTRG